MGDIFTLRGYIFKYSFVDLHYIHYIHFQLSVWGSTGKPSELEVRVTEPLKEGDEITVLS